MLSLTGYFLHMKIGFQLALTGPSSAFLTNKPCKMDDAASNIRQTIAALSPITSGFSLESMIAKTAGATVVASS